MSRIYKFRAWNPDTQEMVSIGILGLWEKFAWPHDRGAIHNCMDWSEDEGFINNPILMQFTGLHDKNGKEIWEGDIVRIDDEIERKLISEVVFYRGAFRDKYWNDEIGSYKHVEVLGNIYENVEVLK